MSSVWAVAAAVALPPGMAVGLVFGIATYDWLRRARRAGGDLLRTPSGTATAMLACLLAGEMFRFSHARAAELPWMLAGLVAVVAAMLTFAVAHRALVAVGLILMGARPSELVGTADENLLQLATLCLGGLTSLAVLYQTWTILLVIAPMFGMNASTPVRRPPTRIIAPSTWRKSGKFQLSGRMAATMLRPTA